MLSLDRIPGLLFIAIAIWIVFKAYRDWTPRSWKVLIFFVLFLLVMGTWFLLVPEAAWRSEMD